MNHLHSSKTLVYRFYHVCFYTIVGQNSIETLKRASRFFLSFVRSFVHNLGRTDLAAFDSRVKFFTSMVQEHADRVWWYFFLFSPVVRDTAFDW